MSETLSKQARTELTDSVGDLVDVDKAGRAHISAGVGSKGGKFMSDHELQLIAAHADQIHEGYGARESESMLHEAVGILEEPKDIRESLYAHGYLDEDEYNDWSDEEVMSFVDDARAEVAEYSDNTTSDVSDTEDGEQAEGRHRAEFSDEDTPMFDSVAQENGVADNQAREGESQAEFEQRQPGRHRAEVDDTHVSTEALQRALDAGVDTAAEEDSNHVSTDGLEQMLDSDIGQGRLVAEATAARQEQEAAYTPRKWWERLRDIATPSGLAAELSRQTSRVSERLGSHKKSKLALGIIGVAALAGGTAWYLVNRHNGGGMTGNGNFFNDAMSHVQDSVNNATEQSKDITGGGTLHRNSGAGGGLEWADFSKAAQNAQPNEGWNQTMLELGIPKDLWGDVLKDAGPKLNKIGEAYYDKRFNDWGISEPGKLSKRALQILATSSKRNGFDLAA